MGLVLVLFVIFTNIINTGGNSFRKVPPYTNDCYQALDTGNATPRHMRMTTCAPPGTTSIHKQIKVPMACITTPFASPQNGEAPVPTVSYPNENPPRCTRCMAYINCSVKWENQGKYLFLETLDPL